MNVVKKSSTGRLKTTSSSQDERRSEVSDSSSRRSKLTRFRLKMRMMSQLGMSGMLAGSKANTVTYQNSFRTQPDLHRRFSQLKAEQIIFSVLNAYLSQKSYDPKRFPLLSKTLSELIKERVKATGLDRYKIVALVTICENKDQSVRVASRCLWNPSLDNHASVVYEGGNFFAVGSVFAVYFD